MFFWRGMVRSNNSFGDISCCDNASKIPGKSAIILFEYDVTVFARIKIDH